MSQLDLDKQELAVTALYAKAEEIAAKVIQNPKDPETTLTSKLDRVLTSRQLGTPIMIMLLGVIFWLTIVGANYPSDLLAQIFHLIETKLLDLTTWLKFPFWLQEALVLGMFRGLAWVVAVMLPPMAIFFPLFTLLEDLGYLPRVAFNLDYFFQKAGTHGKQALTMSMGFGCNAAGVISCRIIDSPRERLIAILTNSLVPCNGRFPILIIMGSITARLAFGREFTAFIPSLIVLSGVLISIFATFIVSKILTLTIFKGTPSFFALELPPYRIPVFSQVLVRSFFDRTLAVLGRAVVVAAPAGLLTWAFAHISVANLTIIEHLTRWLEPFGRSLGLDGVIVLAFILGLPAKEIVIPLMLMIYLGASNMLSLANLDSFSQLLMDNGWNILTVLNFTIFTIFHWPCATTLLTIKKETTSWRLVFLATIIPTLLGISLCFLLAKLFGFFI